MVDSSPSLEDAKDLVDQFKRQASEGDKMRVIENIKKAYPEVLEPFKQILGVSCDA